jgi:hypoxanthine phosphoribosyltransferase
MSFFSESWQEDKSVVSSEASEACELKAKAGEGGGKSAPVRIRKLIGAQRLKRRVKELALEISSDYQEQELVLVGVLKGAFVFMADLARWITVPVRCDFIRVASYGGATTSSGVVRFEFDVTQPLEGQHVILVEDVVDTGLTVSYLVENLRTRRPASLRVCTLLDKPARRKSRVKIHYRGFEIPDVFVVGYGLDYQGLYRNLPFVGYVV